jgi:antitoxin ParD1/3/4
MTGKAVTVTLGEMTERARYHIASGRFASMSEVLREGLRALDRQEAMLDELYRRKIDEAFADPRPSIPLDEAFARLEALSTAKRKG